MRIIIAGSRHMPESAYPLIAEAVARSRFQIEEVVCGGARGADTLGARYAREQGIPVKMFPARWSEYGRAAGPIRNREMRDYADGAIIFIWDGSRGSENMRQQMESAKKPCFVVRNGVLDAQT